jgi:hypothetical protein
MRKLVLLFITAISAQAFAGPSTSGGTDDRQYGYSAAWFVGGSKTIQGCVSVASDFGFSEDEIKSNIISVFSIWSDYMDSRKMDPASRPSSKINLRPCDGTEDITFYFGVTNPQIARAKTEYNNPYGFAERISYDPVAAWGKGFIWIAQNNSIRPNIPDWSNFDRLNGILLHEVGHVLGNEHLSGTIMDADLAIDLSTPPSVSVVESMKLVDHDRQLIACTACDLFDFNPMDGLYSPERAFKLLTGHSPVGSQVTSTFKFDPYNHQIAYLVLTDQVSMNTFAATLDLPVNEQIDTTNLFMVQPDPTSHSGVAGSISHSSSKVVLGKIKSSHGADIQVIGSWNSGFNESFSLETTDGNFLFRALNIP